MGNRDRNLSNLAPKSNTNNNGSGTVLADSTTTPIDISQPTEGRALSNLGPKNPVQGTGMRSIQSEGAQFRGVEVDDPNFNYKLSETQSTAEKFKNAFVGGGALAVAGVLDGINQWNLGDVYDMMKGVEKNYSTELHDVSNKIRGFVQENLPVYEKDPGSVSPSDPGWWANQFQQVGYSGGLIGEAIGEQVLLGALTEGAGNEAAAVKEATSIPRLLNLFKTSTKALAKNFAFGSFKGLQEGYLNGQMTFEEERQHLLDNGIDEQMATNLAAKAASEAYRREAVPTMLLNGLQYGLMSYNPLTGKTAGLLDRVITNKIGRALAVGGTELLSEGFEEMYQAVAASEGKYIADKMAGLPVENDTAKRFGSYLTSPEKWNEFIGGALGGGIFTAAGSARNAIWGNKQEKAQREYYNNIKNNLDAYRAQGYADIALLEAAGLNEEANAKRNSLHITQSLLLHHLDQINEAKQGEGVFDDNLSFYQNVLDAVNNNDTEQLQTLGKAIQRDLTTDEGKQHILDVFPKYIEDANKAKEIYEGLKENYDATELVPLAFRHFAVQDLEGKYKEASAAAIAAKGSMNVSPLLSPQGAEILDLGHRQNAILIELGKIEARMNQTKDSREKDFLEVLSGRLNSSLNQNDQRVEEISKDPTYTQEQKDEDEPILNNPIFNKPYIKALSDEIGIKNAIANLRREINLFDDPQWRREAEVSRIKEAKTQAELDAAKRREEKEKQRQEKKERKNAKKKGNTSTDSTAAPSTDSVEANPVQDAIKDKENEIKTNEAAEEKTDSTGTPVDLSGEQTPQAGTITSPEAALQASEESPSTDVATPNENSSIASAIESTLQGVPEQHQYEPELAPGDYAKVERIAKSIREGQLDFSDEMVSLMQQYPKLLQSLTQNVAEINVAVVDATDLRGKRPQDLTVQEMATLPALDNFEERRKEALAELEKGINAATISRILEIVNGKMIPLDKIEQVLRDKSKLIGSTDYNSREYIEKYIYFATTDFSKLDEEAPVQISQENENARQAELANPTVDIETYLAANELTEHGQKEARENKENETIGKKQAIGAFLYIQGKISAQEFLSPGEAKFGNNKYGYAFNKEVDLTYYADKRAEKYRALYDSISAKYNNSEAVIVPDVVLFDLLPEPIGNFTEAQKDLLRGQMQSYYDNLADRLGQEPTFEDFIRDYIANKTKATTDRLFNGLAEGWKLIGKTADFSRVYDHFFRNVTDIANDIETIINGAIQVREVNKAIENAESVREVEKTGEGVPVFIHRGYVTTEESPKFAYVSRRATTTYEKDEDGNIIIDKQYATDEVAQNTGVNSLSLLDPDGFNPGTKLSLSVPNNFMDVRISIYDGLGSMVESVTFGEYVRRNNLTPEMQQYQDKIPVMISHNGEGVAFVHDVEWYHPQRFLDTKADINKAINSTRDIRQAVLANNGKAVEATVTGKRNTSFEGLKLKNADGSVKTITLSEANPEIRLAVGGTHKGIPQSLRISRTEAIDSSSIINYRDKEGNIAVKPGTTYDIRRYGVDENGQPTYMMFPVSYGRIGTEAQQSFLGALEIYLNSKNPALSSLDVQRNARIAKEIKDKSGIDILSMQGIEVYLSQFAIPFTPKEVYSKDKGDTQEVVKKKAANLIDDARVRIGQDGPKYFYFFQNGNLVLGNTHRPILGSIPILSISPNSLASINPSAIELTNKALTLLRDNILPTFYQGASIAAMTGNNPVVTIDSQGNTAIKEKDYDTYLKNTLRTNIQSIKLPNGKWATSIQPIITYELDSKLGQPAVAPTVAIEPVPAVQPAEATPDQVAALIAQSQASTDWLEDEDELPFGEEEAKKLAESINRIPGLSPVEQEHLIDFIYNQIQTLVDFEAKGEKISKATISQAIRKAFDETVGPIKKYHQDIKANLESVYNSNPEQYPNLVKEIKKQQTAISKIEAVESNYKVMEQDAYDRVIKYTGITEAQINQREEDKGFEFQEGDGERKSDFSTDALTESGKNTSSYRLKRFFAGIQDMEVNLNGTITPKTGFLKLPLYVGFDTVDNVIRATLANSQPDYATMIAQLKANVDAYPWLSNAIDKLEGASKQIQNEFVSNMYSHALNMKFVMYSYNRKANSYSLKIYDTNSNAVARVIQSSWMQNFKRSPLVAVIDDKYVLNRKIAKDMLDQFNRWTSNYPTITDITAKRIEPLLLSSGEGSVIRPDSEARKVIDSKLEQSDIAKVVANNKTYYLSKAEGGYKVSTVSDNSITKAQAKEWLANFGITLSDDTVNELFTRGMWYNKNRIKLAEMFGFSGQTNGLFGMLAYNLSVLQANEEGREILGEEEGDDANPLKEGLIKALASMEARYNVHTISNSFRDGDKSIFGFTANKYITDRVKDLKTNATLIGQLLSTSFSSQSLWLQMLTDPNSNFNDKFDISHMGLTAFKELGKTVYNDRNGINQLADADHELTKLGMFMDMYQGEIQSGFYGIPMRIATMLSPTMSDKSTMTLIKTGVLNITSEQFDDGMVPSRAIIQALYNQTVLPELKRMIRFHTSVNNTGVKNYDKGAEMFLMMPILNDLEIHENGLTLKDAIKAKPEVFTLEAIERDYLPKIEEAIASVLDSLYKEKMEVWTENGYIIRDENGKMSTKFLDNNYLKNRYGNDVDRNVQVAAMDFIVNELISNANSFMAIAGDPAIYYKNDGSTTNVGIAKDTFVNVGKRLANQIAPGVGLADSLNNEYLQIFLADRVSTATNIDYLERLLGKEQAAAYREIEGTDAQEYTTWKEHLYILEKLGRTPDIAIGVTPEEIREAREIFASERSMNSLFDREKAIVNKVMQPIKPVYTGQIFDADKDMMRVVYIKTSSFPLIPQLTKGLELDKLRVAMENAETKSGKTVRASYQTGNKVGSTSNPIKLWKEDGTANDQSLSYENLMSSSIVLPRKNFRIQQDVPFKSAKAKEDKVTLGTQTMKELFGDGILEIEGDIFDYKGKKVSSRFLHQEYIRLFSTLTNERANSLFSELGIDRTTNTPTDVAESAKKLQEILKEEAIGRGYGKQDIESLELDENGNFVIPLWASANYERYEALLNAIVNNRVVKIKMPGYSAVVGSEEGFRYSESVPKDSSIVFTDKWTGELKAAFNENGELQYAQVLAPSKFRRKDGTMIDLLEKRNGVYTYVEQTDNGFRLKEGMIDNELLSLTSFRIPTSGHVSMSQIEIVGFLPAEQGDLMITPKNFTKQMGQDFDIDKLNIYNLWHETDKDGKIKVYSGEDAEKHLQNDIIRIHRAILGNSSDQVQRKIQKVLSIEYAKEQAAMIDNIIGSSDVIFTPLSGEYQKAKMALGAAGKIGTGAYSLDVVFHSLAQQAALTGQPLRLTELITDEQGNTEKVFKTFQFGDIIADGTLGRTKTWGPNGTDGKRDISEVQAERQNIAVDNEKEQVMGKVNLNDLTLDVDKVFNSIGVDDDGKGNNIPFLFLSQPILRDYVKMMRNANSNIAEYNPNKEEEILQILQDKYGIATLDMDAGSLLSGTNLLGQLSGTPDSMIQGLVLGRFLEMKKYGEAIRQVQTTINVDSKGLGKSFFDVLAKRDALSNIANNQLILNAQALIGEFGEEEQPGFVNMGEDVWIKPTTISGAFAVNALSTAINLWGKHFPYDSQVLSKQFSEIVAAMSKDESSEKKKIEIKQEAIREMKKYLFSQSTLGLFDGLAQNERSRLFIDSPTNTSLASYINNLKNLKDDKKVAKLIKDTKILSRLEFELNKEGKSILKFNNAAAEDFEEDGISNSIINLLEKEISLPDYNGQAYNTRMLAQDLIRYTYLSGGVQQAIEFVKHVPIGYLKAVGFTSALSSLNFNTLSNNIFGLSPASIKDVVSQKNGARVSTFTMQYMQHNPNKAFKIEEEKVAEQTTNRQYTSGSSLDNLVSFELKDNPNPPLFISIRNSGIKKKGLNKFQLYYYDRNAYRRVPVLGSFGMSEYQAGSNLYESLVNQAVNTGQMSTVQPTITPSPNKTNEENELPFSVDSKDISTIISNIANSTGIGTMSNVAQALFSHLDSTIKVEINDMNGRRAAGLYSSATHTMTINSLILGMDKEYISKAILHEYVHGLTVNYINQFMDGDTLAPNAPESLKRLNYLFNKVADIIGRDKIAQLNERRAKGEQLSQDEISYIYPAINLKEFIAAALTDTKFQQWMNTQTYPGSTKTLWEKFKEAIKSILNTIVPSIKEDSLASEAISSVLELLEEKSTFVQSEMKMNPTQTELDKNLLDDTSLLPASVLMSRLGFRKGEC